MIINYALIGSIQSLARDANQTLKIGGSGGFSTDMSPGAFISAFLDLAFLIAGFLMFVWAIIGVLQYILAGGNKENLAKARARITWAIIGFLVSLISFALSLYIQNVFALNNKLIL